jgi:hypothetical protein
MHLAIVATSSAPPIGSIGDAKNDYIVINFIGWDSTLPQLEAFLEGTI